MRWLIFFVATALFAVNFEPCYQKNSSAIYNFNGYTGVGLDSKTLLIVAPDMPDAIKGLEITKRNTHLGVLLAKTKTPINFIKLVPTDKALLKEVAVITKNNYEVGKILSRQMGFDTASFSKAVPIGSVLGIKCYMAVGIGVGKDRFIETKYIEHFLATTPLIYGDVGVRFSKKTNKPIAHLVNPYTQKLLKVGDEILSVNNTKINTALEFEDLVIFSSPPKELLIKVLRGKKTLTFKMPLQKLISKSYETETFLESFGVFFDKNLKIIKILDKSKAQNKRLKVGDTLLAIDQQNLSKPQEVAQYISKKPNQISNFLFQRDGFQFFIKLEK